MSIFSSLQINISNTEEKTIPEIMEAEIRNLPPTEEKISEKQEEKKEEKNLYSLKKKHQKKNKKKSNI